MNAYKNFFLVALGALCLLTTACFENVRSADQMYATGDYEHAADEYRQFIRDNPKSPHLPDAYIGLAWSEYRRNNFTEAADAVETLRGRFPGSKLEATAIYLHAVARFSDRRFIEASNELRDLIRDFADDPITPEARFLLGRSDAALLRYAAAAEDFRAYLDKYADGPYAATALLGRADVLQRIARWQEASDVLEEFIKRFPNHPDRPRAMLDLARNKMAFGDYAAAEKILTDFRQQYKLPDLEREAVGKLGEIYELTRRADRAAEMYKSLFDILPPDADSEKAMLAARLAEFHARRGDSEIAHRYYLRLADELKPADREHAAALEWLAVFERSRGYREAAVGYAERFLRDYPRHPEADKVERMLLDIYVEAGRVAEGRDRLATLIRKSYASAEPKDFYRLSYLDMELRDYASALTAVREGLARAQRMEDSSAIVSGLYHSMILNNLEGNLSRAIDAWWKLKEIAPHYVTVTEKVYWDGQEEKFYRENRIPPERQGPKAYQRQNLLSVYVADFGWAAGDTLARALSNSLMTVFASSLSVERDMEFVMRDKMKFVNELIRRDDFSQLPDSYFPLRSNIGADWIVVGDLRRQVDADTGAATILVLDLKLLRIDYDGIFPFEYVYKLTSEEALSSGPILVRETIERLRLYRPVR